MNIDDYRNHIDRAIRELSGEAILNGSHAHATIIVERMFAHAKNCVEILTRKFDPRIYGTAETVEQAMLFLGEPDRKCRILVEEFDQDAFPKHPFIKDLAPFAETGNFEIRQLPPHLSKIVNVNYAVMDDRGFRFEEDKTEAVAVASFGKGTEEFVQKLKGLFDTAWERSVPIFPHQEAVLA